MTPQDIIFSVRDIVQDTNTPYRYSDTMLLRFVNQTLRRVAVMRPDLFSKVGNTQLEPNTTLQSCPTDSLRLIEVFSVVGGNALTEVSRETLDQMYPSWHADAASTPVNFARHIRNPNKFFVYPKPTTGVSVVLEYAQTPKGYGLNDAIQILPESFFPILVDGTVFITESIDNEHANSGRAQLHKEAFETALGANTQARPLTDSENAGNNPRDVI